MGLPVVFYRPTPYDFEGPISSKTEYILNHNINFRSEMRFNWKILSKIQNIISGATQLSSRVYLRLLEPIKDDI